MPPPTMIMLSLSLVDVAAAAEADDILASARRGAAVLGKRKACVVVRDTDNSSNVLMMMVVMERCPALEDRHEAIMRSNKAPRSCRMVVIKYMYIRCVRDKWHNDLMGGVGKKSIHQSAETSTTLFFARFSFPKMHMPHI